MRLQISLDRRIAEAQLEREGHRALSEPRRIDGGVRRLELTAGQSGGDQGQDEVARPAGLPQACAPGAQQQMVVAQQTTGPLPGGGQGRCTYGGWPVPMGPGAQGHPGVPQGDPSGLLPLQGLPAGHPQGSYQGVGEQRARFPCRHWPQG